MKKILFLLLTTALLLNCKDRDQDTDVLPEATQSGKNTGGAIINGKLWVAKIQSPSSIAGGNITSYSHFGNTYKLEITLEEVNYQSSQIKLYITDTQGIAPKTYDVNPSSNIEGYYTDKNFVKYDITSSTGGSVTITHFDISKQIVSGTFSLKAENSNGEIVTITDGRFDKKFSQ
ncbi:DUF6252 family protein [Chryseobacterium arthrosphaerae]|uniref:DUF6252 family protein n=1 Tax=Chryseobacterium arthrosphaerae TaxID=651561 RepID=UPI0023E27D0D|nr:DUF6252 family protein [Chryseobacterium arthrosphaerae]WES98286.1 DUF6252 family protein [Chryseobacterium arthrosphaerae]